MENKANLVDVIKVLESTIDTANKGIEAFKTQVAEAEAPSLAHMLHWKVESAMEDSLTAKYFGTCLKALQKNLSEEKLDHLKEHYMDWILQKSESIANKSTSVLSNMEKELELQVLTNLFKILSGRTW